MIKENLGLGSYIIKWCTLSEFCQTNKYKYNLCKPYCILICNLNMKYGNTLTSLADFIC